MNRVAVPGVRELPMADFDYELPPTQVALHPLARRDESRLLRVDVVRGAWQHLYFTDIIEEIPLGSLVLMNASRVIPARLLVQKATGGAAEVLLLEPLDAHALALSATSRSQWRALVGGKRIAAGDRLTGPAGLEIQVREKTGADAIVELTWTDGRALAEKLEQIGSTPLPPYLKRENIPADRERYQTVYARDAGSVAAPTAGLHFTPSMLERLQARARLEYVHLHVGAGTFRPVEAADARQHAMHAETVSIPLSTIEALAETSRARDAGSQARVIAVGTTSLRTLESLAICAARVWAGGPLLEEGYLARQWNGREWPAATDAELFEGLARAMRGQGLIHLEGKTDLMITPGYPRMHADRLITNFHQPKSTLLLLVAAFSQSGDLWKRVYSEAVARGYRFLSYGDSSIWIRR